jgi:hypothetical protein
MSSWMRSTRYRDMPCSSESERQTTVTLRATSARWSAAWPAGVRAADDDDVAVAAERGLGGRSAVVNAGADQLVDARSLEPPVVDSVRRDARAGLDGRAAGQLELERYAVCRASRARAPRRQDSAPSRDACAWMSAASSDPLTPSGSRVVLDPRARPGLARPERALDDERS